LASQSVWSLRRLEIVGPRRLQNLASWAQYDESFVPDMELV